MSWTWTLVSESGADLSEVDVPQFEDQTEAETWIGDCFEELLERGVDAVTLLEDGAVVYSNMSLHP